MAEVPEVETVVRDIRATLLGRTILGAAVVVPATVRFATPDEFAPAVAGACIVEAERRAKWALVRLDGARTLAIHFMLFGHLRIQPEGAPREATLCLALHLDGAEELRLLDRLAYARVALLPDAELDNRLGLDTLGPEVLDATFTPHTLEDRLGKKRAPIKSVLLDQHVVAGMGNRDADESLWRADRSAAPGARSGAGRCRAADRRDARGAGGRAEPTRHAGGPVGSAQHPA